ncbi:carboxypeptidase regulatory-like domain-containing protein [Trinickia dinghuensis]|uniref:Carboxypeptidase regulatory-like domain-containing protein n=1 Tax=Trinickia dinghuensis TaxID=2291023 RepID=A0A3D8JXJ2_9BURK|nr:carboxypeptidase regulatory-like domain-containing protein [Trinickia dinghuensis]RDU97853.1 carboxypeptidase regulatory-like domain-containing protein [Trinickia dinghuensis]
MNNKRPTRGIRIALGASLSSLTLLAACGGGTSSTGSQPSQQAATSIGGTVAIGTALAGATVTVIDANGKTATGTSNADGSYTVSVQGLTAPLVLEAQDPSGASSLLYSVVPTLTSSSTSLTANVTPLTTAVAALMMASGNPADLLTSPSTVTPANVSNAEKVLDQALGPILSANNVASTLDPIATAFTANQTGLDAVIDSVSVTASTKGTGLQITSLADPNTAIQLNSSTSVSTTLSAPSQPANYLASFQASISQCMTDVQGGASITSAAACTQAIDANYLNQGFSTPQARHPQPYVAGVKLTGIKTLAMLPAGTIPNTTGPVALIYMLYTNASGQPGFVSDFVQQTANGWQLIGNQEQYDLYIASFVGRLQYVDQADAANNRYESGLRFLIPTTVTVNGNSTVVGSALVTGPGLPANGVWLVLSGHGAYLTFPATARTVPMYCPGLPVSTTCTMSEGTSSEYKWAWSPISGSGVTVPSTSDYASQSSDPSTIQQFGAYAVTLYNPSQQQIGTPQTVVNIAAIQAPQAGAQVAWQTLGTDVISNFLTTGGSATGAGVSSLSLDWTESALNPITPTSILTGEVTQAPNSVATLGFDYYSSPAIGQSGTNYSATDTNLLTENPLPSDSRRLIALLEQVDGDFYVNTWQYKN